MRYLTAGESHGPGLTIILEGVPAGLSVDIDLVNEELKKRQSGYGRGRRMQIESDRVDVRAGIRHGRTTGAPISLWIENKDHTHRRESSPCPNLLTIRRDSVLYPFHRIVPERFTQLTRKFEGDDRFDDERGGRDGTRVTALDLSEERLFRLDVDRRERFV